MKKNIFILFILLFIGLDNTNSARYGNHAVNYNHPGPSFLPTMLGGGPNRGTRCNTDGAVDAISPVAPNANQYALALNNTNWDLNPHGNAVINIGSAGTMNCLYWDSTKPSSTTPAAFNGWTNVTNQTITFTISDTGGSKLKSYKVFKSTSINNPSHTIWGPDVQVDLQAVAAANSLNRSYSYVGVNTEAYKFRIEVTDVAGNVSNLSPYSNITKIDTTTPTINDVTNNNNSNLLAVHNYNYSFTVAVNGGSPINNINGVRERYNNGLVNLAYNCNASPCNVPWDISNVDLARQANGGREYSFNLNQICDSAGNCWNGPQTYNHNVYANSNEMVNDGTYNGSQKNITSNPFSGITNIADGTLKNLSITLKDKYGNEVVPAPGIFRTIDFNWDIANTMYLNQETRIGAKSVYIDRNSDSGNYLNNRLPGGATSLNNEASTNGIYTYGFKVYTPTSNQDNGPVSDKDAIFNINGINFDVNGNLGIVANQSLNQVYPIVTKFNPLYYSELSGEIISDLFIEGGRQDSFIKIRKNSPIITSTDTLQLSYAGVDSNKFNFYGGTTIGNALPGGVPITSTPSDILNTIAFDGNNKTLYTYIVQKPGSVGNTSNLIFATHITYDITAPNGAGIIKPIYNSDIIGKVSYHGAVINGKGNQSGLKISGQATTNSNNQILDQQFANDVIIVGNTDKLLAKTEIVKNGYNFIKNLTGETALGSTLTNINTPNVGTFQNNVIYFGAETGQGNKIYNLGNGANIGINTKKTILVVGGNLYIKSNTYYSGANGMLGIIVLKDKDGNGGNIYVDPDVTNIVGALFAEKSIIGYNGVNELDGSTSISLLKNQLHIYGSLFSENTIGGSREATPRCPYYITSACNLTLAQKYDLNYLRRYYLIPDPLSIGHKKPANNGKTIGGGTYGGGGTITIPPANANFRGKITTTNDKYAGNSVVIEYNGNIQLNPPPLFY